MQTRFMGKKVKDGYAYMELKHYIFGGQREIKFKRHEQEMGVHIEHGPPTIAVSNDLVVLTSR